MAVQPQNKRPEQNPTAGKIVRTPAPDEISQIRNPKGVGYGANGPQPSWTAPGTAVRSPLAQNLAESQADSEDVLSKVIAGGVAGRDDRVPADGNTQQRTVSDTSYPIAHGCEGAKPGPKMSNAIDTTAIAQPARKPQ